MLTWCSLKLIAYKQYLCLYFFSVDRRIEARISKRRIKSWQSLNFCAHWDCNWEVQIFSLRHNTWRFCLCEESDNKKGAGGGRSGVLHPSLSLPSLEHMFLLGVKINKSPVVLLCPISIPSTSCPIREECRPHTRVQDSTDGSEGLSKHSDHLLGKT